jgi:hypothetical protein
MEALLWQMEGIAVGFICLEVSSPSMETQDAHEHILVVGKVGNSLDILNMGVLTKRMD